MTTFPDPSAVPPSAPPAADASVDIAEAVRRLAERTSEIAAASGQPIPPPPPEDHGARAPQAAAPPSSQVETAHLAVAERIARILERTERAMTEPPSPAPSVPRSPAAGTARQRPLIDDTETFDPGRDPAVMFAEAERNARIVQDRANRLGLINGRFAVMAPWLAIFVLSVIGLAIGLIDTFRVEQGQASGIAQGAPAVLALFGMLVVMSIYFLATRGSGSSTV